MAVSVANTLITNTFDFWRNRTNELAYAMSNNVVTTETVATVGSAIVTGSFIANQHISGTSSINATMNTSSVYITNSTSNIAMTIPTADQASNGTYFLASNSTWRYIPSSNSYTTYDYVSAYKIDSFKKAQYSVADYIVHIKDRSETGNAVHCSRLFVTHANDAAVAYVTEYSVMTTNSSVGILGTFTANADSTDIRLYFTPTVTNTGVKIIRTIV